MHWCNHLCFCTSSFLEKKFLARIQQSEEHFVAYCHRHVTFISEKYSILFLPIIFGFLHVEKCILKSFSILLLISAIQGLLCWPHHHHHNDCRTAVEYVLCLTIAAGFLIFFFSRKTYPTTNYFVLQFKKYTYTFT